MEGYCVREKAKRELKNPVAVTLKNGKPATKGTCASCGATIFVIGKTPPQIIAGVIGRDLPICGVGPFGFLWTKDKQLNKETHR